ncbi:MAG: inositol 2-dehydrogenase [Anaerolineae bacterium]|nr:inositol 2-dehydrogenase [Anaerolineales bacterium]MCQ3977320.1 inositol 2-dehydrogenase [Anaerolineae bacterium]
MNAKLPVGVIGLGRMGQVYARHLAGRIPQAKIVAVADALEERARAFAAELEGVAWSTDYRDVLANPGVKAVFVISPTSTHREVVIAAAEAGKAIFCEKPVALTLADTDAMLAVIAQKGVLFQAGFMRRFDAGYMAAKKQIEAGIIGQPVTFKSVGRDPFCPDLEYARPSVSGGLILDMAIHDFDLGRWLMGDEVKRVYTEGGTLAFPQLNTVGDIDNAVVNMLFKNGTLGNVEVSRNALYGYDIRTEILGTTGGVQIGYYRQTPLLVLTRQGISHDMVPYLMERFGEAYLAQAQDFVERVRAEQPPVVTGQDARAALEIALAATQSYHQTRPIELPLDAEK